jgi:hypothetical protein
LFFDERLADVSRIDNNRNAGDFLDHRFRAFRNDENSHGFGTKGDNRGRASDQNRSQHCLNRHLFSRHRRKIVGAYQRLAIRRQMDRGFSGAGLPDLSQLDLSAIRIDEHGRIIRGVEVRVKNSSAGSITCHLPNCGS